MFKFAGCDNRGLAQDHFEVFVTDMPGSEDHR